MPLARGRYDGDGIVVAGRPRASAVEAQMARDLAMFKMRLDGSSNGEIARFFKCSTRTVRGRVNALPPHAKERALELVG